MVEVDEAKTMWEIKNSQAEPRVDKTGKEGFLIEFIGANGKILAKKESLKAIYKPDKNDKYVRARVTYCTKTENGFEKLFAWTQPVFID